MPVASKTTLGENLLRIIAASFGDLPPQFDLVLKWEIDGQSAMSEEAALTTLYVV